MQQDTESHLASKRHLLLQSLLRYRDRKRQVLTRPDLVTPVTAESRPVIAGFRVPPVLRGTSIASTHFLRRFLNAGLPLTIHLEQSVIHATKARESVTMLYLLVAHAPEVRMDGSALIPLNWTHRSQIPRETRLRSMRTLLRGTAIIGSDSQ